MMAAPSPEELIARYGLRSPEQLAAELGFHVIRLNEPPALSGVTIFSEYLPVNKIILYKNTLRTLAKSRREPLIRLEQWHIAHELYHGLEENSGSSSWRVRETEADLWADALLMLVPFVSTKQLNV